MKKLKRHGRHAPGVPEQLQVELLKIPRKIREMKVEPRRGAEGWRRRSRRPRSGRSRRSRRRRGPRRRRRDAARRHSTLAASRGRRRTCARRCGRDDHVRQRVAAGRRARRRPIAKTIKVKGPKSTFGQRLAEFGEPPSATRLRRAQRQRDGASLRSDPAMTADIHTSPRSRAGYPRSRAHEPPSRALFYSQDYDIQIRRAAHASSRRAGSPLLREGRARGGAAALS